MPKWCVRLVYVTQDEQIIHQFAITIDERPDIIDEPAFWAAWFFSAVHHQKLPVHVLVYTLSANCAYLYPMKRNRLILLQVCLWALLFISELWSAYSSEIIAAHKNFTWRLGAHNFIIQIGYITIPIVCFYCSYLFVAPQLFAKRNYLLAFVYAVLTLAVIVSLRYVIEYYFFLPVLGFDNYRGHPWPAGDYIENIFFYYFPRYFVYGLMYFFAESWYTNKHLKQELEKERSAAELAFLRSQLNPHFLFNTINDIYSLTYQNQNKPLRRF